MPPYFLSCERKQTQFMDRSVALRHFIVENHRKPRTLLSIACAQVDEITRWSKTYTTQKFLKNLKIKNFSMYLKFSLIRH
jgi:hypothetical protein